MNIPKLRFNGFSDEWEEGIISDYGNFYYGKSAPKWSLSEEATIPCVRYGELYTTHNEIIKEIKSYTTIEKENLKFSKGGEVLIPRVGEKSLDFCLCTYLPFSDIAIGEMISVYNTNQNPLFMVYYFRAKMKYEFAKKVEGGNVSNLYYYYLNNIKVILPSLPEQEKIADFLSTLDEKIQVEKDILENLINIKKGYTQKMFNQELRFDGFSDEWKEVKLGDVCEIVDYRGKTPIKTSSGILLVTAKNIKKGYIDYNSSKEYIDENDYLNVMSRGIPKLGDVLITTEVPFGNVAQVDIENIALAQRVIKYSGKDNILINKFLKYSLLSEKFQKKLLLTSTGCIVKGIKGSVLHKLSIQLPSLPEQEKIADFLSTIDEKINAQSEIIDNLILLKKGLLQQLFC